LLRSSAFVVPIRLVTRPPDRKKSFVASFMAAPKAYQRYILGWHGQKAIPKISLRVTNPAPADVARPAYGLHRVGTAQEAHSSHWQRRAQAIRQTPTAAHVTADDRRVRFVDHCDVWFAAGGGARRSGTLLLLLSLRPWKAGAYSGSAPRPGTRVRVRAGPTPCNRAGTARTPRLTATSWGGVALSPLLAGRIAPSILAAVRVLPEPTPPMMAMRGLPLSVCRVALAGRENGPTVAGSRAARNCPSIAQHQVVG
jgi:hypothetical protein